MSRVAWILYGSLERRTGGTLYDRKIVTGLRERGITIEVLSIARRDRDCDQASALVRHLARTRPDVVVGDELCFPELGFVFRHTPFTRRILLVHHLTAWEIEPPPILQRRARHGEAIVLRHADAVVATSEATKARLLREGCLAPIEVVLPGADRLPPLARKPTGDPPVFLFVGALIPRKRVLELVAAFARLEVLARLRIVGSEAHDPTYAAAVAQAVDAASPSAIDLLGELDDHALAVELAAADVLVLPSTLEGYGIAATEALAAGLPVLASRTTALGEALAPAADAAVFFDPHAGGLFRALDELARDRERRAVLAVAARAAGDRLPRWETAVGNFASHVSGGVERGLRPRTARSPSGRDRSGRDGKRLARSARRSGP